MTRWTRLAAALALAPLPLVSFAAASTASSTPILLLGFEEKSLTEGASTFENSGWTVLEATLVTTGRGRVTPTSSPSGNAVRLPAFDGSDDGDHAVIQVRDLIGRDRLSPDSAPFGFGADFTLDSHSSEAGSSDNGDNLIQRGLHQDASQYKLQIDHARPSCAVNGANGYAIVFGSVVDTDQWYRAKCELADNYLTVSWARVGSDGTVGSWQQASVQAQVGDVTFTNDVPTSIGGKLTAVDTVAPKGSDQFNGAIDNATFWRISDASAAKLAAKASVRVAAAQAGK